MSFILKFLISISEFYLFHIFSFPFLSVIFASFLFCSYWFLWVHFDSFRFLSYRFFLILFFSVLFCSYLFLSILFDSFLICSYIFLLILFFSYQFRNINIRTNYTMYFNRWTYRCSLPVSDELTNWLWELPVSQKVFFCK